MFKRKPDERDKAINDLTAEIENAAILVNIVRNGRKMIFTFKRHGEFFNIETMGLLGDNVEEWLRKAGL